MSSFVQDVDRYCEAYGVSRKDRTVLLAHWPLVKCLWQADYSHGWLKAVSRAALPVFQKHTITQRVRTRRQEQVTFPLCFDRCDFGSFKEIFWGGAYSCLLESERPRSVVDLGANTGMASLYFLVNFPTIERLLMVEANPALIGKIKDNLSSFEMTRDVVVDNACVSDNSENTTDFYISSNHRESSVNPASQSAGQRKVSVRNLSLNDLLDAHGFAEVDLLKMDIEGAEYDLIQHPESFLRFKTMIAEIHGAPDKRQSFVAAIESVGFRVEMRDDPQQAACELMMARKD